MKKFCALVLLAAFLLSAMLSVFASTASAQSAYIYHNNITLQQDLEKLVDAHPGLAKLQSIGKSVLGQDIWCIEITNFTDCVSAGRPIIYIDGSHHGNEQCGMELCYSFILFLLDEYSTNASAKDLVDTRHFYIIPLMNPDGNLLDQRTNAHDVDINRNYPFKWDGSDCTLPITSPASEPEIQANMAMIKQVKPDLYVTFHTGAVVMIYPWGWTPDSPPDEQAYIRLCDEVANRTGLEYGQINSPAMYPAFGTSLDWTYGELGIMSYCIEVDNEQWIPFSQQDMRIRLLPSFVALEYSAHVVDLLGANLVTSNISIYEANDNSFRIGFRITNNGFEDAENITSKISWNCACNVLSVSPMPDKLASGETKKIELTVTMDEPNNGSLSVLFECAKTKQLPKTEIGYMSCAFRTSDGKISMTAVSYDLNEADFECGKIYAEKSAPLQTPGFETAFALSTFAFSVLLFGKRMIK